MAKHYIVKCDGCDSVIRQCRCPSWSRPKPTMYETCDECKKPTVVVEEDEGNAPMRKRAKIQQDLIRKHKDGNTKRDNR